MLLNEMEDIKLFLVAGALFFTIASIVLSHTRDVYVQTFVLWASLEGILRFYCDIEVHPLVVCLPIVLLVYVVHAITKHNEEHFTVDEENWDTLKECGITVAESPWTTPDEIAAITIAKTLDETGTLTKSLEDFLHLNKPDKRTL